MLGMFLLCFAVGSGLLSFGVMVWFMARQLE